MSDIKHNIEPIINQHFSCNQGLLATYASYQKRGYEMIFAESWGFRFVKGDKPFGTSLNPGYQERRNILFEKFHGIQMKEQQYTSKEYLLELLQTVLPSSPVIIYCDVFDCPWNMSYKRNHIDHYILITGIDSLSKRVYVLDPYSTNDENIIDIDSIAQEKSKIYSFITIPSYNPQVEDYRMEITNSLNHIENIGFFENLECFYTDFKIRYDEVIQSKYTDIYANPLVLNLNRIAHQRYCYCLFLNNMIKKEIIDSSILKTIENIAEKYSLLRTLIVKGIIRGKTNVECIDNIGEIVREEYEAYKKMKSFV